MSEHRAATIFGGLLVAAVAGAAAAVPAAWAQGRGGPAAMRLAVGAGYGLLAAAAFVGARPRGRWLVASLILVGGPLAVAIVLPWATRMNDDLAWMHAATPALWACALIVALTTPSEPVAEAAPDVRPCPGCGYDRRSSPIGPCPECGALAATAGRVRRRRRWRAALVGWLIGAVPGLAAWILLTRWLLSLG